ncbi:MAG: tetratricopeptide repeat protein [Desulfuromonadaceae bacterium]
MAETLYQEKAYLDSVAHYAELVPRVGDDEQSSLVFFAQARGLLFAGNSKEAAIRLGDVTSLWPGTEGSWRAQLLLLNQVVLEDRENKGMEALPILFEIASKSTCREVREEATFKHLLLDNVQQANLRSIAECEDFLVQFGQGRYRSHVETLLSEVLPRVIQDLIAAEDYLNALVLVEKHRQRLLAGTTNPAFLLDLSAAFRRLGLLEKSANVYQYMLDAYQGNPAKEPFYLPWVQVLKEQGNGRLAIEYADRYLSCYPSGGDCQTLRLLKVKILHDEGRDKEAAKILTSGEMSRGLEADLLAGEVFWMLKRPDKVEAFLGRALADVQARQQHPEAVIFLAESLFQLKQWRRSLALYEELLSDATFSDQARYRSAQILLIQGQKVEGLNFLRILVEKGQYPQWRKMAATTLLSEQAGEL